MLIFRCSSSQPECFILTEGLCSGYCLTAWKAATQVFDMFRIASSARIARSPVAQGRGSKLVLRNCISWAASGLVSYLVGYRAVPWYCLR